MKTIWENAGLEVNASFSEDEAGDFPIQPTTVHWRLYCSTTGRALNEHTAATVTQVQDSLGETIAYTSLIEIPGSLNAIQNERNATEIKELTIVTDKDTPREYSEVYRYVVRRNRGR